LNLAGYWGDMVTGSQSSVPAGVMPATTETDCFAPRHESPELPTRQRHPTTSRNGTVDSQYASMSTSSTASASSNVDYDDDNDEDDDDDGDDDRVIRFIESPV